MDWLNVLIEKAQGMSTEEITWISIGIAGQSLFMMRFIVQWIVSEKQRDSVIPIAFWYFSIGGGAIMLSYAIWRVDPVFILGQSTGLFIYLRNLYFVTQRRKAEKELAAAPVPVPPKTDAP